MFDCNSAFSKYHDALVDAHIKLMHPENNREKQEAMKDFLRWFLAIYTNTEDKFTQYNLEKKYFIYKIPFYDVYITAHNGQIDIDVKNNSNISSARLEISETEEIFKEFGIDLKGMLKQLADSEND